jgi:hypothetical protein
MPGYGSTDHHHDVRVSTYVDPSVADQLDRLAEERDLSRSACAREILRDGLRRLADRAAS